MKKWIKEKWAFIVNRKIEVLAIVLFTAVSAMVYMTWFYNGNNRAIIYEFLRDVAAGCLVLIGAVALLRRAASQNQIAAAQNKTAEATLQSNEQTIFKDSLNFLINGSDIIRLSGIYNLHELGIKNPNRSKDILEILCAHLRSKTNEEDYQENHKSEPSVEISSLLELLASEKSELREACEKSSGERYILNFKGAFLNGADLRGAWLREADLSHSQLQEADLSRAQMQSAQLRKAQMQGAWLEKAQMHGADMSKTQMQEANLSRAQMQGADLYEAQMQGADLPNAQMQGVWLGDAQMQGANLQNAQLQGAKLLMAELHGANLEGAQLQISQLDHAKLPGTILKDAQLQGADLNNVDLHGASGRPPTKSSEQDAVDCMKSRLNKNTELDDKVLFSGGLSQEDKENIEKALKQAKRYCTDPETLEWIESRQQALQELDVDTEPSYDMPKEAITGILNFYEVNQIIEEYENAINWKQDADEDD